MTSNLWHVFDLDFDLDFGHHFWPRFWPRFLTSFLCHVFRPQKRCSIWPRIRHSIWPRFWPPFELGSGFLVKWTTGFLVKWNIGWPERPFLAINPKKRTWFLGQMEYRTWFPGQMVARTDQNPGQMECRLDKTDLFFFSSVLFLVF